MMKLDNAIFTDTGIVDRDKIYQVDDEAFAREVLGKIPENNDDLASVSELKKLTLSKQKSSKSKVKGLQRKKSKLGSIETSFKVKSQTFVHSEEQGELVNLILLDDLDPKSGGRDLDPQEQMRREELLDPYYQMGSNFPTY